MKKIAIKTIKFYQKHISPSLGSNCKYRPTCSHYAIDAYEKHNFFKATGLTVWRILRCNPFSKGGYDPVPDKKRGGKPCSEDEATEKNSNH